MIRLSSRAWIILGAVIAVVAAANLALGGYRLATGEFGGIAMLVTGLALTGVAIICWYLGARTRGRS